MTRRNLLRNVEDEGAKLKGRGAVLFASDRYVLVFFLIMATIAMNAFLGDQALGVAALAIALALTLAVTLVTSDSRRWTAFVATGFAALTVAGAAWIAIFGETPWPRFATKIGLLGMTVVLGLVIGRRIIRHPVIDINTLAGAASIYLLLGLVFALTYSFVGGALAEFWHIGRTPAQAFLASARPVRPSDFLYFSFITLTTVGYGDVTPATEFGRMLAVCEALLGQLYLVTVVAVLVSNMGRRRDETPLASRA